MSVSIGRLTSEVEVAAPSTQTSGADATAHRLAELHQLRLRRAALDRVLARTRDHDDDD